MLEPGGHGSRVKVTLRSYYVVAAFMSFWLGGVVLFNIVVLAGALTGAGHIEDLALTLLFLAFGFGFIAIGRLLAHPDRAGLLDFIRQTTGA